MRYYVWFGMIVWILGFACSYQGLIMIIMLKGYLNEMLSINCHVLFPKFFYISLFMVNLPLFVYLMCLLPVWWSYNVCVIREKMVMQIFLAWSKLQRGWNRLGGYYFFSWFQSNSENYENFFCFL